MEFRRSLSAGKESAELSFFFKNESETIRGGPIYSVIIIVKRSVEYHVRLSIEYRLKLAACTL